MIINVLVRGHSWEEEKYIKEQVEVKPYGIFESITQRLPSSRGRRKTG